MTANKISLGTPYRWFGEAFALCRAHPRPIFGGACLLLLLALLPSLAQVLIEAALHPSASMRALLQLVFVLIGLVLVPVASGGYFRLLHGLREGQGGSSGAVFALFQDSAAARRLIATNLLFVLLSIVVLGGLALLLGGSALIDYARALMALQPGATQLPAFPPGLFGLLSVVIILAMILSTAQQLALAQAALSARSVPTAAGDGLQVALRHIAAWLLFYLPLALIGFIAAVIVGVVVGLLAVLLSAISPTLALVLFAPLALLLMLLIYALMFSFYYLAWRETLGENLAPTPSNEHHFAA